MKKIRLGFNGLDQMAIMFLCLGSINICAIPAQAQKSSMKALKTHSESKQNQQAIENYSKALQVNPKDEKTYCDRGNLYVTLKEYQKAIDDYSQALVLNPK